MKDYSVFNDEDLAVFIKQHKGTIHTKEFPSRCSICRFIARFEAAEGFVNAPSGLKSAEAFNRWKRIAEKGKKD
jgi:hypothetical protein